jgi:hypothetical protein
VVGEGKKKFWLMALHVTVINSKGRGGLMRDYHGLNTDISRLSITVYSFVTVNTINMYVWTHSLLLSMIST